MRTFQRALRIWAGITLFFFCWSFLPLWQAVAYAAAPKGSGAGVQGPDAGSRPEKIGTDKLMTGDRFEKALESIRENTSRAGEKLAKGEDDTREREAIKAKRVEIESADVEFKKEFAATEKRLKDAKLPKEILDRHAKFVKHYGNNLKELRTNLDDIEQAKTTSDRRAKIEKARLHLEKIKAPLRLQKRDPNNLPFKATKAGKTHEPRLKKEQFEKDFPPQKTVRSPRTAELEKFYNSAFRNPNSALNHKPVQLAFNGPISDVPLTLPLATRGEGAISQITLADSAPFLLAQAVDQPSVDDLAETPDVQFTDAIRAKAQELGGKPVNIYNWVRNNIEYTPTYGSIQGADQCLETKQCNDMDTASLLIALLRASGIYAHYAYGTIELPMDKAMSWTGMTDPMSTAELFSYNGIPVKLVISGGSVRKIRLEHAWVEAWIDYLPSRGAVHKQGDTWIPLDASYKQYQASGGIDLAASVPMDVQSVVSQITGSATISEPGSYATNVQCSSVSQYRDDYRTQVQNYLSADQPGVSMSQVLGTRTITAQSYPYLLGTLAYDVITTGGAYSEVPAGLRHTVTFDLVNADRYSDNYSETSLTLTAGLPTLAGKRITLGYVPATDADQAVIDLYTPARHADGTPNGLNEYPSSLPVYLIQVKSELRVDGSVIAMGLPTELSGYENLTVRVSSPNMGAGDQELTIKAGEYVAIAMGAGPVSVTHLDKAQTGLEDTRNRIKSGSLTGLTKDDVLGTFLHASAIANLAEIDALTNVRSRLMGVAGVRLPSSSSVMLMLGTSYFFASR
jgi:transglutaminase-like putative cysteine protease